MLSLYQRYISKESERSINIKYKLRKKLSDSILPLHSIFIPMIENPQQIFNSALTEIRKLLSENTVIRFNKHLESLKRQTIKIEHSKLASPLTETCFRNDHHKSKRSIRQQDEYSTPKNNLAQSRARSQTMPHRFFDDMPTQTKSTKKRACSVQWHPLPKK